jgi:hypothetical protein
MTIFEYISQQFTSLGLMLNEADCVNMGIWNHSDILTEANQPEVFISFVIYIPTLLVRPFSISEGGVSITRARKADIEAFYAIQCKRLGLKDMLKPRAKFV